MDDNSQSRENHELSIIVISEVEDMLFWHTPSTRTRCSRFSRHQTSKSRISTTQLTGGNHPGHGHPSNWHFPFYSTYTTYNLFQTLNLRQRNKHFKHAEKIQPRRGKESNPNWWFLQFPISTRLTRQWSSREHTEPAPAMRAAVKTVLSCQSFALSPEKVDFCA